jgi:cytochrome c
VTRRAGALGLALALGSVTLSASPRADPARGERVFQRCYACHSVVAGDDGLPGPSLRCVLGRRAGSLPGFEFSPALVEAGRRGLVWTRTALDAFLADPLAVVPGTTMTLPGLPDAGDRRDLVDYLQERAGRCAGGHSGPAPPVATAPRPASGSPSVTGGVATT